MLLVSRNLKKLKSPSSTHLFLFTIFDFPKCPIILMLDNFPVIIRLPFSNFVHINHGFIMSIRFVQTKLPHHMVLLCILKPRRVSPPPEAKGFLLVIRIPTNPISALFTFKDFISTYHWYFTIFAYYCISHDYNGNNQYKGKSRNKASAYHMV